MQVTQPDSVIRTESLLVELGGLPILREVSIDIKRGDLTALMGGNGSGKTTLVRTLLGLIPHQGGQIELFGTPDNDFHEWNRIGYVPQRGTVNIKQATVAEVVATGRLSVRRPFSLTSKSDRRRIAQALEQVELSDRAHRPFAHLSGGQQQRVLIARALAGEAELLILDEPFAGVDLGVQDSLATLLGGLNRQGTTVLVVLHETGALTPLLTNAIVLREGRVIHVGAPPAEPDHYHERDERAEERLLHGLIGESH
ncbi:MAG: ABC transporter ATP-binding protein [Actinobacteria bacterium HGW-Actinobacteria-2]|nr:MAG: ABC transporter ATP-binding protein [Actinobacteria bacterium HGW-Actinobacteria-2]